MLRTSLMILTMVSSIYAAGAVNNKEISTPDVISKPASEEKYQIVANNITSKENVVTASGDVVIFSKTYYITAQKVIYNKDNETFELFDDVVVLKDNALQLNSNYAFMDMKNENSNQSPLLMIHKDSLLWINSLKSSKSDNDVKLNDSILSSCDCDDPAWSIKFSSGNYNIEEQWIETYNNRLYLGSTPVFYVPYFAFPADDTRKTGILLPTLGHSSSEGLLYGQPIYIAPKDNYDIELIPQIRTQRGEGVYSYLRYADTPNSTLYLSGGIFKDKNKYYSEKSLRNQKHYGYNINYEREDLISKNDNHQDGLFVDVDWINDVEYKNLEDEKHSDSYEKKIESKINYFYQTPKFYTGVYFRHYLDTSLSSNKTTLQQFPQVQAHSYLQPFLLDNLTYSTDMQYTKYVRDTGISADVLDISIPISYGFSFFDDYIKLTLTNETTSSNLQYSNTSTNYKDGTYIENKNIITLGTDLLKSYDTSIHTLNLNAELTIPNGVVEDGDLYSISNSNSELDPFPVSKTKKTVAFSLNHSLYSKQDLRQIINHKIKQSIIYDEFDSTTLSDLKNEITFNYILGQLTNRLIYSQEDNELTESSTGVGFKYNDYFFNASYYMSKDTPNSGKENLESYTFNAGFNFHRDYTLSYEQDYNIEKQLKSRDALVFNIDDKCWSFNIEYKKELVANSSTTNSSAVNQDAIYFTVELKQLTGVKYNHKIRGQ